VGLDTMDDVQTVRWNRLQVHTTSVIREDYVLGSTRISAIDNAKW
jgi:hypothetical protein